MDVTYIVPEQIGLRLALLTRGLHLRFALLCPSQPGERGGGLRVSATAGQPDRGLGQEGDCQQEEEGGPGRDECEPLPGEKQPGQVPRQHPASDLQRA